MRQVGFQNSFPMRVWGVGRTRTSVRSSLSRFTWHSGCDSEESGPKMQKLYFPACFHFDFLCYSPFSSSFSLFLFPLGWQAGKCSLCIFSVALRSIWQSKARANSVLVHLNGPIEVCRQSQHGAGPWSTGAEAVGGHGALMTQQSPCPGSTWCCAIDTLNALAGHAAAKHLVSTWVSRRHSICLRRLLRG